MQYVRVSDPACSFLEKHSPGDETNDALDMIVNDITLTLLIITLSFVFVVADNRWPIEIYENKNFPLYVNSPCN